MKIKDLLTDESKWCKNILAKTKLGDPVYPYEDAAYSFCINGAFEKCYKISPPSEEYIEARKKLSEVIGYNAARWNNAPERTFQEVKDLVEKLDI